MGQIAALNLSIPSADLKKISRIRSIHSSLAIEGNTLSQEQVAMLVDENLVGGPDKDILEVRNAAKAYDLLHQLVPWRKKDLLRAHKLLMKDLIPNPGRFREGNVGIIKGSSIQHVAPPQHLVPSQMSKLLKYLKTSTDLYLIKGCVFHYELEFIHPFKDGNGRMGRLWQTLIHMQDYPVYQFISVEQMVKNHQSDYYNALSISDKEGHSTVFIEYMLDRIHEALLDLLENAKPSDSFEKRIAAAFQKFDNRAFSRKAYMSVNRTISAATASRDLKKAVELKILSRTGIKRLATYFFEVGWTP